VSTRRLVTTGLILSVIIAIVTLAVSRRPPSPVSGTVLAAEGSAATVSVDRSTTATPPRPINAADRSISAVRATTLTPSSGCRAEGERSTPVRNCGLVTLTDGHGINLDSQASDWDSHITGGDDLTFYGQQLDNSLPGNGLIEISPDEPSYAACASAPAQDFHGSVAIAGTGSGATYCAKTPLGRYTLIRLVGNWTSESIRLLVITWETPPIP
jgi:hypothetical protein